MTITNAVVVLFVCTWCSLLSPSLAINYNSPISPSDYQYVIGKGFATSFFKSENRLDEFKQNGDQIIQDVANRGFTNLRLRCRADLENLNMTSFLNDLETAVDLCITYGVTPIVSWINHEAEAWATQKRRTDYVNWWTAVANKLKDKNYRLGFNLFTELGVDECGNDCSDSLRENTNKYNVWTRRAVDAIRGTGGNNAKRILILASPKKTGKGLELIDENIYEDDDYMMAEWHLYASGPNQNVYLDDDGNITKYSAKYWSGNGSTVGRENVDKCFEPAAEFTQDSGILTYFGAWMAQSKSGELNEKEVINFGEYFVQACGNIPWTINELNTYYDTGLVQWKTNIQNFNGKDLNMSLVLDAIK